MCRCDAVVPSDAFDSAAADLTSSLRSYNKVNGVPSCANKPLLTDLLRNDWGFTGYVVSDCIAIQQARTMLLLLLSLVLSLLLLPLL